MFDITLNHLNLTYDLVTNKLLESHGYCQDAVKCGNIVRDEVASDYDKLDEFKKNGHVEYVFYDDIFPFRRFFDFCRIFIQATKGKESYVEGGYDAANSGFDKNGKFRMEIIINVTCPHAYEIFRVARVVVAHEVLHAYEDYNRRLNGKQSLEAFYDNGYYGAAEEVYSENNEPEKTLAYVIEFLSDVERNAYISQTISELEDIKMCHAPKPEAFFNTLKQTESFKALMNIRAIVSDYVAMVKGKGREEDKERIERYFNNIYKGGRKIHRSFSSIVNFLVKKYNAFYRQYITNVGKMYYDKLCFDRSFR